MDGSTSWVEICGYVDAAVTRRIRIVGKRLKPPKIMNTAARATHGFISASECISLDMHTLRTQPLLVVCGSHAARMQPYQERPVAGQILGEPTQTFLPTEPSESEWSVCFQI